MADFAPATEPKPNPYGYGSDCVCGAPLSTTDYETFVCAGKPEHRWRLTVRPGGGKSWLGVKAEAQA